MVPFMQITMEPIASIRPYPSNPRKNKTAITKLAKILGEVGFRQPIVVDADRVIIAGHTRLEAAKRLGMKEVPVHIATDMSPEQVRAWRIADNRVGQEAEWDMDLLKVEVGELLDAGIDPDFLGFDEPELKELMLDGFAIIGPEDEEPKEKNAVISFNIVFDDTDQQATWFSFMKFLRREFPDRDTLANRLTAFIEQGDFTVQG